MLGCCLLFPQPPHSFPALRSSPGDCRSGMLNSMVSPPSSQCSSSGHWKQNPRLFPVIHNDLCSLRVCSPPAQWSWLIPLQPVENLTGPWTICLLLPWSLCNFVTLLWRAVGLTSVQAVPPPGSLSCLLWLRSYSSFPHPDHTSSSDPCCPLHHMRVYPSVPEEKKKPWERQRVVYLENVQDAAAMEPWGVLETIGLRCKPPFT